MSTMNPLRESNGELLISTWQQFLKEFATEEECFKELNRRVGTQSNHKCRYCGNINLLKSKSYRVLICSQCKKKTWITGGGFFHRIRLARPWLACIWLMEHGVAINSSQFAKLVGIASSTALTIFKKLTIVIAAQMGEERVASSLFCAVLSKRSRETSARAHPISEQEELERNLLKNNEAAVANNNTKTSTSPSGLSGQLQVVYDLLSKEPVRFESLCQQTSIKAGELSATLVLLELDGHIVRLAGDQYMRVDSDLTESYREGATYVVSALVDFVRATFQGISRKYLQNYLAAYSCLMDRSRWSRGCLLEACFRFRYISYNEILQYVSPYLVNIAGTQRV